MGRESESQAAYSHIPTGDSLMDPEGGASQAVGSEPEPELDAGPDSAGTSDLQRMHSDSLVNVEDAYKTPGPSINPFLNRTPHPGAVEWTKMIVLLPLAILRVVLCMVFILLGAPFAYLALCGYDPGDDPAVPATLSCWRKALFFPMRVSVRAVLFCLGFVWVVERGDRAPATEAPLLLPNHLGAIEPLYLMCRHGVSHVAKADLIDTPIMGALSKGVLQVFVRRQAAEAPKPGTHSAREVRGVIEQRARKMGADNFPQLCLYPEATCTNGLAVISFKLGAFFPGAPVQPVAIKHDHNWFDPSLTEGSSYYVWRFLTQFYHQMSVEYLPVVQPTVEERKDPRLFASRVRTAISTALGVTETEHALGDFFLAKTAAKGGTDMFAAIDTPLGELSNLLKLNEQELKFYMQRFAKIDSNKDGRVDLAGFEEGLQTQPGNDYVRQLFEMFDQDGDGVLHYAEFVSGLLWINSKVTDAEAAHFAFTLLDTNEDGRVDRAEIETAVANHRIETFTQEQVTKLFEQMDPDGKGWVEEADAVRFVAENPDIMSNTRKTALLQRFAAILVEDKVQERTQA